MTKANPQLRSTGARRVTKRERRRAINQARRHWRKVAGAEHVRRYGFRLPRSFWSNLNPRDERRWRRTPPADRCDMWFKAFRPDEYMRRVKARLAATSDRVRPPPARGRPDGTE